MPNLEIGIIPPERRLLLPLEPHLDLCHRFICAPLSSLNIGSKVRCESLSRCLTIDNTATNIGCRREGRGGEILTVSKCWNGREVCRMLLGSREACSRKLSRIRLERHLAGRLRVGEEERCLSQ